MSSKAHTILVISDDKWVDRELRKALSGLDEQSAVTVIRSRKELDTSQRPDLIILDLTLSAEKPVDILRWVRTESNYRAVPVFALGSHTLADAVTEAYAIGANSCLLKESEPNGFEKIARAIWNYASLIKSSGWNCPA